MGDLVLKDNFQEVRLMEKIKRYKLKFDITKEQLISMGFKEGGTYVHNEAKMVLIHCIVIHNTTEIKKEEWQSQNT